LESFEQVYTSHWPILVKNLNVNAFLEYERSFGTRLNCAFRWTHGHGDYPPRIFLQNLGLSTRVIQEYRNEHYGLAGRVAPTLISDDERLVEKFIEDVKNFRKKYPWLYHDVEELKETNRKFTIKSN
jgi:hypothetical protein